MKLLQIYAVIIKSNGFKSQWHISFQTIYSICMNETNLSISKID